MSELRQRKDKVVEDRAKPARFCTNCGEHLLASSVKFCSYCGTPVIREPSSTIEVVKKNSVVVEEEDDAITCASLIRSAWSMNHPLYRKAFRKVPPPKPAPKSDEEPKQPELDDNYVEIPVWFLVVRMLLIFVVFVGMHYILTTYLWPSNRVTRQQYREQIMAQMCPKGEMCDYNLPDHLPFEDEFS